MLQKKYICEMSIKNHSTKPSAKMSTLQLSAYGGNNHIRRALHMPALNMVRYEQKPFLNLYEQIYERSKIKMKGYTAIQKKLLIIIYTLWKNEQVYNPNYKKTSKDDEKKLSFV